MSKLTLDSNSAFYNYVCYYTYETNKDKVKDFQYLSQSTVKPYEYIPRSERGNPDYSIKMCSPNDLTFDFTFEGKKITFDHKTKLDENGNPEILLDEIV